MYEVKPEFAPDELERGRVYRFRARNFFYGVWDGKGGFIGIREKFADIYLFTEYHADTGGSVGTVWDISATEHVVPPEIEIVERFERRCWECEQPVEFVPDVPGTRVPGRQKHLDRALDEDHDPHGKVYSPGNEALARFLAPLWVDDLDPDDTTRRDYLVAYFNSEGAERERIMRAEFDRRKEARPW